MAKEIIGEPAMALVAKVPPAVVGGRKRERVSVFARLHVSVRVEGWVRV